MSPSLPARLVSLIILTTVALTCVANENDALVMSLVSASEQASKEGNYPEAESALTNAIVASKDSPNRALLFSNLGVIRMEMGKDTSALAALDSAVAIAPRSVTILSNRARALARLNLPLPAIKDLDTAIAIDSTLLDALYLRGLLKMKLGDVESAENDFNCMANLQPSSSLTHTALGTLYVETGRFAQALPHFNKLIEITPDPEFYASRALCRIMTDRFSEASEDIEKGIKAEPANGEFYLLRAMLRKREYRPDDARQDAIRAKELGIPSYRLKGLI